MAKKAKGTPKRTGKRHHKYLFYYQFRWAERKLRHILRRNGFAAAKAWAEAHGALLTLHKLAGKLT